MTKEQLGNLIIESNELLYHTAKTLLYNDSDCADAIQNMIVKAFTHYKEIKVDKYAKTWMIRILKNECFKIMRNEKKYTSFDELLIKDAYEHKDYTDLYNAVMKLPKEIRLAVTLYYVEGFKVKEIAEIEDISESAVKNRLLRARNQLKGILDGEEA